MSLDATDNRADLAVVTMIYNDSDFLAIWAKYYSTQVAPENCYIIDHGSDVKPNLPHFNVVRIPRTPKDNAIRTAFVSDFCNGLLKYYRTVMYTDVDEIVVADPRKYGGLIDLSQNMPSETLHALGFEIQQIPSEEQRIDLSRAILAQRRWVRFWGGECKCVMTRRPLTWSPGFHDSNYRPEFAQLFLFHLRYYDLDTGLERLGRTRAQAWALPTAGEHQRWPDEKWKAIFLAFADFPRRTDVPFESEEEPIKELIRRMQATFESRKLQVYRMDLNVNVNELWAIPEWFAGLF